MSRRFWLTLLGGLMIVPLAAEPIRQQQSIGSIAITLQAENDRVSLSGSVQIELSIEGPIPLVVTLPKELLSEATRPFWRIRMEGPTSTQTLQGGRLRWQQRFRIDPYRFGDAVPLQFNPVLVRAGNATQDQSVAIDQPLLMRVTTQIVEAKTEQLRPVTDYEAVPDPIPAAANESFWLWLLAGLLLIGIVLLGRIRSRTPEPVLERFSPPWLQRELHDLAQAALTDRDWWHRFAALLKGHLGWKLHQTVDHLTAAELNLLLERSERIAEPIRSEWRERLAMLDQFRFAPDLDGAVAANLRNAWLAWAESLVNPEKPVDD